MSIMIGLPCGGGVVSEKTTLGLFNLAKTLVRNDISHGLLTLANSSLITQARSKVANFFINNTEHEYLFFLDSDIGFDPQDVVKLLSHRVPIVSGVYPMKIIPEKYCIDISEPEILNVILLLSESVAVTVPIDNSFSSTLKILLEVKIGASPVFKSYTLTFPS